MSIEHFIIGVLAALLIAQQLYWSRLFSHMTNKLMSRNYFEYAQVKKFEADKPLKPESKQDDYMVDPEDERQAQLANATFGVGF